MILKSPLLFPLLLGAVALFVGASLIIPALAATPTSKTYQGKTYYAVKANDGTMNTGKKVCALVGRSCIGYTALGTNAVCKLFNPNARTLVSVNGSKSTFYCDGAPQKGLACERTLKTCQVCPACNVNLDCNTDLTSMNQFREAYVECGALIRSSSSKSSARRRSSSSKPYKPPEKPKEDTKAYPGKVMCEFYQPTGPTATVKSNKKLVTCGSPGAGDRYCKLVMNSIYAKAEKCEENGVVICTIPCDRQQTPLSRCAADINRPRGVNAPPINGCPKPGTTPAGTKQPGEVCKHGGDCASTFCLGTGRPYGTDLQQCSCKQSVYDITCKGQPTTTLPATGRKAGEVCQHGGNCASGKCIGTGRPYGSDLQQCSCSWDKLTYGC